MNYALVGAFVVLLATVLMAATLWLAAGNAFRQPADLYLAIAEESVAGLNVSAPVKYNGVDVGKVQSIQLDPVDPARVRLIFALERGTPIRQDTIAVLKIQGLTGIAYVELTGGARDSPPLRGTPEEPLPVIPTKPSLSARLENVLTSVLAKLDRTSSNIDAILSDENRAAVTSALTDLAALARTLAARRDTIDAGIASAARTFENGARVTEQLGPVIERIGPVIERIGPMIERIGRSADALEKFGQEAAQASTGAGQTVAQVGAEVQRMGAETLPDLQRLLAELQALASSLRHLSEQTERNPASLLFGRSPAPAGPGESSTTKAAP